MKQIISIFITLTLFLGLSTTAQETSGTPIDFNGTVDSIDGTTIVVTGLTVDVSGIDPTIVAQLDLGLAITISGTLENGIVTAVVLVLPETVATPEPVAAEEVPITDTEPFTAPVNVPTDANYTVTFNGSTYDGSQTTFNYTVTGMGVPAALSHFDIEIPLCTPQLELVAFAPADAVELGLDPTTGVDGIKWDSPLGESESRTYSITFLGYVAEGTVTSAVKNGNGFFTVPVGGPSCAQPSVDLEKYVSVDGATWADADEAPGIEALEGGQVSYRLVVTNDGNVPLSNIVLSDSLVDASSCAIPAELEPDASTECILGPVAVTQSQLTNTATVLASYGAMAVDDTDNANYFTGALPSIDVEKFVSVGSETGWIDADAAPGADAQEGDQVFFRFVVANNGNVPLTGVALSDNLVNTGTCAIPADLDPAASAECVVGPFAATASQHTNVAIATATGNGITVEDSDAANYFGRTEPVTSGSFTIAFLGSVYANGQTTFSYGVVGTNMPPDLSHFNLGIPICSTALQVAVYNPTDAVSFGIDPTTGVKGIKWDLPLLSTSSRTYSITFEGNVAVGSITAAVKDGNGAHLVTVPGPACDVAQIVVEKSLSVDGGASWNDANSAPGVDVELDGQVFYRLRVSNEGNSTLSDITLTDDNTDISSCTIPAELVATAFFECIVGPLPVAQGQRVNTATARGTFANGAGVSVDTDSAYYFGGDRPEIEVQGYVSSNGGASWVDADAAPGLIVEPGINVSFRYVVTNTGNVAVQGITLVGTLGDISACSIPATLEPGASFVCLAGSVTAGVGQQGDTATATASAGGMTVNDSDNSRFFGGQLDDDEAVIIIIEGPVDAIDGNTIIIFGFPVVLDPDDPRLTVIQVGDILRIEGADNGGLLIAIVFVFTNVEIFVNNGIVWRDSGTCGNAPPPWAPAWGWRARCEGGGTTVIIIGGTTNVPSGCKLTGFGNGNIRLKCSRGSRGSRGSGSRRS